MPPPGDDSGQFTQQVSGMDVLRALRSHHEPVATAGDLAGGLGVSAETVRRHLAALHDDGRVARRAVGARAVVWWVVHEDADSRTEETDPVADPFFDAAPFAVPAPVDETEIDAVVYDASES